MLHFNPPFVILSLARCGIPFMIQHTLSASWTPCVVDPAGLCLHHTCAVHPYTYIYIHHLINKDMLMWCWLSLFLILCWKIFHDLRQRCNRATQWRCDVERREVHINKVYSLAIKVCCALRNTKHTKLKHTNIHSSPIHVGQQSRNKHIPKKHVLANFMCLIVFMWISRINVRIFSLFTSKLISAR